MDREVEFNTELTKIHHKNYVRNSRAVTVAWFIFCACYTILNVVAFIQPFWIGDTDESPGVGYFGLYEWCERVQGSDYRCSGDFLDFTTISNNYFMASSFLVGGAALLFILSIICMLLFLFLKTATVLRMCGWLQLIAAIFMAVACLIYPNAFDDPNFQRICGQNAKAYTMDKCQIRWAYILGIVLIFDALILSILAFILAACQAKKIPEIEKEKDEDGYVNNVFQDTTAPDEITPRIVPQSLRHRQNYTAFQSRVSQANTEPLVIPVDNFDDSTNGSNNSNNSNASGSLRLPQSESSSPRETLEKSGSQRSMSEPSGSPRSYDSNPPMEFPEEEDLGGFQDGEDLNESSKDIHL